MIRHFFKIFFTSLVLLFVILSITALGYIIVDKDTNFGFFTADNENAQGQENNAVEVINFDYNTEIGKAAKESSRINILVVGLENHRTDTILVVSYDTEQKLADIISIPRDTYFPRDVNDRPDNKKINSVYANEGIEGLTQAVQEILGIPIEKYVIFNYEGVIACVDLLGGVEVNVPFHMEYSDPYDDPPLVIDISEGVQTLNGENSLKFLRYRKGYVNQDLGRIEAQQQFIKSAVKKAIGLQLPALIKEAYSYVETNFTTGELLGLAGNIIGFSTDNINMNLLPGIETPLEGLSFFISDDDEINNLVYTIYGMPIKNGNVDNVQSN